MWKIYIEYSDKSKITLTGKGNEISLRLAEKYFNEYVAGNICKATYQKYPKKANEPIDLYEKIEQLQLEVEE